MRGWQQANLESTVSLYQTPNRDLGNTSQNQHKSINRVENCFKHSIGPRTPALCRGTLLNVEGSLSGVWYKDTSVWGLPEVPNLAEILDFQQFALAYDSVVPNFL